MPSDNEMQPDPDDKDFPPDLVEADTVARLVEDDDTIVSAGEETIATVDEIIGKTVAEHYEVLKHIGSGGMSRVYKARHKILNRNVAIKFILSQLAYDEHVVARLRQEAEATHLLNHKNICTVREFGLYEGKYPYLVMDYVDGATLAELLQEQRPLSVSKAIQYAILMCRGVAYAHEKGVIHRDLKPSNLIVCPQASKEEELKIVDFGIAKILREDEKGPNLTQTGDIIGTPNYMSPEQAIGAQLTARTDIYSAGCVLFEMIFGKPVFEGSSAIEIMFKHINEEPFVPYVAESPHVSAILKRALAKKPQHRYESMDEMVDDLVASYRREAPVNTGQGTMSLGLGAGTNAIIGFILIIGTILYMFFSGSVFNLSKPAELYERGLSAQKQGRHVQAIEDFDRAITLGSDYDKVDVYIARSKSYSALGDGVAAVKDARQAIQRSSETYPAAYIALARAYLTSGDLAAAEKTVKTTMREVDLISPQERSDADCIQALVCLRKGETQAAFKYANRAVHNYESLFSIETGIKISLATGNYENAIALCDAGIKNLDQKGPLYLERARAQAKLGRTPGAIKDIEKARELIEDERAISDTLLEIGREISQADKKPENTVSPGKDSRRQHDTFEPDQSPD